jgi:hypothetical protein
METLYKYLGIGAIVLGIFCAFFFGFKCKQASGSARLNEFETDFGGGSFSTSIKSGFMQFFWGCMVLVSLFGALLGFGSLGSSAKKNDTNSQIERTEVKPEVIQTPIVNTVRQEMPVEQIQPQNNSTSDKAKEYEGDDPIVRARLGLPPK